MSLCIYVYIHIYIYILLVIRAATTAQDFDLIDPWRHKIRSLLRGVFPWGSTLDFEQMLLRMMCFSPESCMHIYIYIYIHIYIYIYTWFSGGAVVI